MDSLLQALKPCMGNLFFRTILILFVANSSFAMGSAQLSLAPSCKVAMAPPAAIQGFANKYFLGKLSPSSQLESPFNMVFELFKESDAPRYHSPNEVAKIPEIRMRLAEGDFLGLEFGNAGKDPIVILSGRVELYAKSKTKKKLQRVLSVAAKNVQFSSSLGDKLYLITNSSIIIAGKNQMPIHIPLNLNPEMMTEIESAQKIKGMAYKIDSEVNIAFEYVPGDAKNMLESKIGFFNLESGLFTSLSSKSIFQPTKEYISFVRPGGVSSTQFTFDNMEAHIPLVFSGHVNHTTQHQIYMSPYDFKIHVITYGASKVLQDIFDGKPAT